MILLITPCSKVQACAEALGKAMDETVKITSSFSLAMVDVRAQEFSAVVIDQSLVEADPSEADALVQHVGMAIPVYVNFAISGLERVTRELRAALCRRKKESLLARQDAERALRSELKGTITALLLSCEMALDVTHLPSAAEAKVRMIYELAREIRAKLGIAATAG